MVGTSEQQGAASGMKHPTTTTDSAFSFQRAMTIPEDCFTDPAHISADMKHGLLCIKIEKKPILTGTAEMAAGGDVGVKIPINKQQLPPLAASLTEEELETDRFKDTLSS